MAGSVVQFGAGLCGGGTLSITLGSAPTSGNWLVCLSTHYQNNPTANPGWTQYYNQNGVSEDGTCAFYKLCGGAESATQTPFAGINEGMACIWEIGGLTGVFATDFQQSANGFDLTTTPAFTTSSFNTSSVNSMVFGLCGGAIAAGGTGVAPAVTTGQTNDTSVTDSVGVHRSGGARFFHKFFAANTSPVQFTATFGVNQLDGMYGLVVMNWTSLGTNLTGRARVKVSGRDNGAALAALLLARARVKVSGRIFYGALQPLVAWARLAVHLRMPLPYGVALRGRAHAQVRGRVVPAGTLTLQGRSRIQVKLRGFGSQALFGRISVKTKMAKAKFSTFRGYGATVRDIIGVIWPFNQ